MTTKGYIKSELLAAKEKQIHIKKGVTLNHFFLGLAMIFIAILALNYVHLLAGIPLLYVGLCVLLSYEGSIIDIEHKQLKNYLDFFIFKVGQWQNIEHYNSVVLQLTSESQQMNSRGTSTNVKTKTYDIYLTNSGRDKIELKEFVNYNQAKDMLNTIAHSLNLQYYNKYEEAKAKLVVKPKR